MMLYEKTYAAQATCICLSKPKTVYHRYEYYYHCGCSRPLPILPKHTHSVLLLHRIKLDYKSIISVLPA